MNSPKDKAEGIWHEARVGGGLALGVLVFLSLENVVVLLYLVPKFEQIFRDALPGQPLPVATSIILNDRLTILLLTLTWTILCIMLTRICKPWARLCTNLGMVWNILQIAAIVSVLLMTMFGPAGGMSDASA